MIKFLKNWFIKRTERRAIQLYIRGYAFAQSQFDGCHSPEKTADSLRLYTDEAKTFGSFDAFDQGILSCIADKRLRP